MLFTKIIKDDTVLQYRVSNTIVSKHKYYKLLNNWAFTHGGCVQITTFDRSKRGNIVQKTHMSV